jgi:hypothetical protein
VRASPRSAITAATNDANARPKPSPITAAKPVSIVDAVARTHARLPSSEVEPRQAARRLHRQPFRVRRSSAVGPSEGSSPLCPVSFDQPRLVVGGAVSGFEALGPADRSLTATFRQSAGKDIHHP